MGFKGVPFIYEEKDGDGRYGEDDDDKKVAAFGIFLSSQAISNYDLFGILKKKIPVQQMLQQQLTEQLPLFFHRLLMMI